MGWVWTAVVVWVLLAVPVAVLLGRSIRSADHRELETPGPDAPVTATQARSART